MLVSRGGKHFQVRQECGGTRGMEIEQDGKERSVHISQYFKEQKDVCV